jgi:hypothetical protein
VEADTFFPPYEELVKSSFRLTSREEFEGFAFVRYVRNR